ncbi:MAG: CD3324 family protein [Peptococcaceae bacterium]|nr:CD3324 family protein [Peptococcaceae bacterium]
MKYINANEILPEALVRELQQYLSGGYIYVPSVQAKGWGEVSGYRRELASRNRAIVCAYREGTTVPELAKRYALSESAIRKIIYQQ